MFSYEIYFFQIVIFFHLLIIIHQRCLLVPKTKRILRCPNIGQYHYAYDILLGSISNKSQTRCKFFRCSNLIVRVDTAIVIWRMMIVESNSGSYNTVLIQDHLAIVIIQYDVYKQADRCRALSKVTKLFTGVLGSMKRKMAFWSTIQVALPR